MISLSNIKKDQNQQKQMFIDLNCDILPAFLKISVIDFVSVQLFP